jgi:hypothetical protein
MEQIHHIQFWPMSDGRWGMRVNFEFVTTVVPGTRWYQYNATNRGDRLQGWSTPGNSNRADKWERATTGSKQQTFRSYSSVPFTTNKYQNTDATSIRFLLVYTTSTSTSSTCSYWYYFKLIIKIIKTPITIVLSFQCQRQTSILQRSRLYSIYNQNNVGKP